MQQEETFETERLEELRRDREKIGVSVIETQGVASLPRTIVADEEDRQIQRQGNILYFYRKDFLYQKSSSEYSLVLLYSKKEN